MSAQGGRKRKVSDEGFADDFDDDELMNLGNDTATKPFNGSTMGRGNASVRHASSSSSSHSNENNKGPVNYSNLK